jgi:hypothetical protein
VSSDQVVDRRHTKRVFRKESMSRIERTRIRMPSGSIVDIIGDEVRVIPLRIPPEVKVVPTLRSCLALAVHLEQPPFTPLS